MKINWGWYWKAIKNCVRNQRISQKVERVATSDFYFLVKLEEPTEEVYSIKDEKALATLELKMKDANPIDSLIFLGIFNWFNIYCKPEDEQKARQIRDITWEQTVCFQQIKDITFPMFAKKEK